MSQTARLEQLALQVRFAFLLREGFDTDYAEIARAVGCSEAACRAFVDHTTAHLCVFFQPTGVTVTQRINCMQQSPELFKQRPEFSMLTRLPPHDVPDDVFDKVRTQLSEKELSDLTFSVMAINAWNRVNVGFTSVPWRLAALSYTRVLR